MGGRVENPELASFGGNQSERKYTVDDLESEPAMTLAPPTQCTLNPGSRTPVEPNALFSFPARHTAVILLQLSSNFRCKIITALSQPLTRLEPNIAAYLDRYAQVVGPLT